MNSHLLWARAAANASRGLQMLQLGGALQKGIFTPSYELSEQLAFSCFGRARTAANASRGPVQCAGASVLYTGSTVQC